MTMTHFEATSPAVHIVLDLGGVFTHPPSEGLKLATPTGSVSVKRLTSTATWMAYECGKLEEEECYRLLASQYGLQASDLASAISRGRATSVYDRDLVAALRAFKKAHSNVVFILASNISLPDYTALQVLWGSEFWSLFDHAFPSSTVGTRKPSPRFYRHVLRATHSIPQETLFIDDRPENVLAAAALGMRGIVFQNAGGLLQSLNNALGDSVQRGRAFLTANAGRHYSMVDDSDVVNENYSQLLILDLTGDTNIVDFQKPDRFWNFFKGASKYTTEQYPDDIDTTSLALASIPYSPATAHSILDEILDYVDEDGLVTLYIDKTRPRVDSVICLNVLTLFAIYGRGYQLPETLRWIQDILLNRAYINGTRYYPTPEWFLYYVVRLLVRSKDEVLREQLEAPLRTRIQERIGAEGDALCLAMRVLTCSAVGVVNRPDTEKLKAAQLEDGGWESSLMYLFPGARKGLGNRGVTAAFAVKALEEQAKL